ICDTESCNKQTAQSEETAFRSPEKQKSNSGDEDRDNHNGAGREALNETTAKDTAYDHCHQKEADSSGGICFDQSQYLLQIISAPEDHAEFHRHCQHDCNPIDPEQRWKRLAGFVWLSICGSCFQ